MSIHEKHRMCPYAIGLGVCVSIQKRSEGVCQYMKSLGCVHTGWDWKLCVHTRECT